MMPFSFYFLSALKAYSAFPQFRIHVQANRSFSFLKGGRKSACSTCFPYPVCTFSFAKRPSFVRMSVD